MAIVLLYDVSTPSPIIGLVARSNWHDSRRLGSGSYGSVYKESGISKFFAAKSGSLQGELEDGSEVAIKVRWLGKKVNVKLVREEAIDLGALGASGTAPEMAGFEEEAS